ncbi:MAG: 2,3-bisphosphoglycerate-independent phosphoglycerate mutase, partial [Euryarchaeota archaeon]|nr:2,3-bisphosphoglycerate-independent phosphoglycerate mutase [Euryarchaeota archaeon]
MARPRLPVLLLVIDGWGVAPAGPHNAITLAEPRHMARLAREFPSTELEASGPAVGLPAGQMGNSEVGHLSIGAGRVVDQDFVRINKAVETGALGRAPAIRELLDYCKSGGHALHVMGLLGPGGVHSHERHLLGVLEVAARARVEGVWVHHFLDGRDTPPKSALGFATRLEPLIRKSGARVATVAGRYWAMDRDKRWDRTERAYRMLVELEGEKAKDAPAAIEAAYARGTTDEFVEPTVLEGAVALRPGDAVLGYNFRPDRMRQIVRAVGDPRFKDFPTKRLDLRIVSLTQYDKTFEAFGVKVAFPPDHPRETLGELYATLGLRQLRIAETEKYAHVTYFFSGGREEPFGGEERLLVPSPKVATYDVRPEMSAREITDALLRRLADASFDLIVLNFANPDMVGHTGMLGPTVKAVAVTDECIGRIADACKERGILFAITADHGNAETMLDDRGQPQTAHTLSRVPFILAHDSVRGRTLSAGGLGSVAPTILEAVGLRAPAEMTSPSLWEA